MVAAMRPAFDRIGKPMVHRVVVDVVDKVGEVIVVADFFGFEVGAEEAATTVVHLVVGFRIAIKQVGELLANTSI